MEKLKGAPPPGPPEGSPVLASVEVGWRIATFAGDCLVEDDKGWASITEIWASYLVWCVKGRKVPLAYSLFVDEFTSIAGEAGIPRRQIGANVVFPTVVVRFDP